MKQRIIVGVLGTILILGILAGIYTPVYPIFLMIASAVAIFELESVANITNKGLRIVSTIFGALVPLFLAYSYNGFIEKHVGFTVHAGTFVVFYVVVLLIISLIDYESIRFNHVAITLFASLVIPFGFSSFVLVRDAYLYTNILNGNKKECIFFIFLALGSAWVTDAGAYFVGKKFGKHKMAPHISPKKTWEGAIGGVIVALVFNMCMLLAFDKLYIHGPAFKYWYIIPVSLILSVMGMLGDLTASAVKRNYGIKDFGGLLPGHGGVLDRFDSCLFTMPTMYVILTFSDSAIVVVRSLMSLIRK